MTLKEMIEKRAYELFVQRGGQHGYHMQDWLRAEGEIVGSQAKQPSTKKTAVKKTAKKAAAKKSTKKTAKKAAKKI
jgi:topoisomerase IA-like protein